MPLAELLSLIMPVAIWLPEWRAFVLQPYAAYGSVLADGVLLPTEL
jgi:hypothetical protein